MPPTALADILPDLPVISNRTNPKSIQTPTDTTPHVHGHTTTRPIEALSHGSLTLPGIPAFPTHALHRQHLKNHLAAAFRHWSREGFVEGMSGHISVRDPEHAHAFWTNPLGRHFGLVRASDLILLDMNSGAVLDAGTSGRPANEAGYLIHRAVHRARPDVHAVCHAHTVYGKAWSVFGRELEMLTQDACKFYGAHSVYNSYGGVVLAEEEGEQIAKALGPTNKACVLRNHGLLTTGHTVDEAAFLFLSMEHACQGQLLAEAAAANGLPKILITDEEASYNAQMESDKEILYEEFQVYYEYEDEMTGGAFKK